MSPHSKSKQPLLFLLVSFEVESMKLSFHFVALLFFLICFSSLSACLMTTEQGKNIELDKVRGEDFVSELEGTDPMAKLMGMEDCISGDEECLKRRMTMEAHLDYIYTQHHRH